MNRLQASKLISTLDILVLSFKKIGNISLLSIASSLNVNTILTSMNILQHQIGNNGAISITKALKVNSSLILLDLSDNQFTCVIMLQWNKIGSKGEDTITDVWELNLTLENLGINFQNHEILFVMQHILGCGNYLRGKSKL
jgi:hypothetical protein